MKRKWLILTLLMILLFAGNASASKILYVKVDYKDNYKSSAYYYYRIHDWGLRQEAQIFACLAKRGIQYETFIYDDSKEALLRDKLRSGDYDFSILNSGYSVAPSYSGDSLKYFWQPDTNFSKTPMFVWFGMDARSGTSTNAYSSGAADASTTANRWFQSSPRFSSFAINSEVYTALDSFKINWHNPANNTYGTKRASGVSGVTPYLWHIDGSDSFMVFWKREANGNTIYYLSARDGTAGQLLDAILCKYVDDYKPVDFALTIDDYGMIRQSGSGKNYYTGLLGLTYGDGMAKEDNFWSKLKDFFEVTDSLDLKMTIGCSMMNLRKTWADSNSWQRWVDIYDSVLADNPHFELVWLDYGYNDPTDSTTVLFSTASSYNDWVAQGHDTSAITSDTMAYLYDRWCDTMQAYGFEFSHAIIPPADIYKGWKGNLADTVLNFCAKYNMPIRIRFAESANYTDYYSMYERNDRVVILHEWYWTPDSLLLSDNEEQEYMWTWFFGPIMGWSPAVSGLNSGVTSSADYWINSNYDFSGVNEDDLYTLRNYPCLVLHTGNVRSSTYTRTEQTLFLIKVKQYIDFLEWLAGGKQLYRSRFMTELARDIGDYLRRN